MSIIKSKFSDQNKVQQIIKLLIPNLSEIHNELTGPKYLLGSSKIFMKQDFNMLLENNRKKLLQKMIDSCEVIKVALYKYHKMD